MFDLTNEIYHNADKAREHLESIQWPHGPDCPHCGNADTDRITKLKGKSTRPGVYKCMECRKPFSVTVGTVFERSKIPLNKWVLATHLMASSKKGISAHQLHRMLDVTYKTAWFMAHRIREAMSEDVKTSGPIGGEGDIVEVDETYIGKREDQTPPASREGRPYKSKKLGVRKQTVVALVKRGGSVCSFTVKDANKETVREILFRNVPRGATLYTDESHLYTKTGKEYAEHQYVKHSAKEYVRGNVHTNTIEKVFSVFKHGMVGVYQHCAEKHPHRYLAEFDFRYNRRSALEINDRMRAEQLLAASRASA